jgi:hypothetical protein
MAEEPRPLRGCESCGQVDDHPKSVHYVDPNSPESELRDEVLDRLLENGISGTALKELQDRNTIIRHHDCCHEAGCPTGLCDEVIDKHGTKTGDTLLRSIQKEG